MGNFIKCTCCGAGESPNVDAVIDTEQRERLNNTNNANQNTQTQVDTNEQKQSTNNTNNTTSSSTVVTRREIRSLSRSQQSRFFDAVDKMLESKSGRGTSEFYRCASIHGEPPPLYCHHGRETFPGWHRIYLMDFEKSLQAADRSLGRDGNIALPYWDPTINPSDGIPKMVRERFTGWPADFWPSSLRNHSRAQRLTRASDSQVFAQLRAMNVPRDYSDCLLATQHWAHASTRFSGTYPSIETPHNSIHVIAGGSGGQMSSVAWAAYDIVFWLHHCNVDRIYESYLKIEPDSKDEFENFQDTQRVDMYDTVYEPFSKPNGNKYSAKDTFNTRVLGYRYDILTQAPPQQLREAPTFILFSQVKIYEFESKCYQIHAFIVDKEKEYEFKVPQTLNDINYESDNYAGGVGIFGRGMECENCVNRPPQDIVINITDSLRKLGVSRYKIKPIICILETTQDSILLKPVCDTPLPQPVITGPLFINKNGKELLDQDDKKTNNTKEVEALQKYLQKFGYYAPEKKIDGDYGDYTRQAVSDYQIATGNLKVDGIAGPKTRNAMINNKRCDNIDPFAKNNVSDLQVNFRESNYSNSKIIKYFISVCPGYLKKKQVENTIKKACDEYDKNTQLSFLKVFDEKECDIKFSWSMFNKEEDPLRFDGSGGVLGRGGNGYVEFDMAERWVSGMNPNDKNISNLYDPKTWHRGQPNVSLYYTALHELGHALGLVHSIDPNDVMSPWYNPKQIKLSKNDIINIKKILNEK